MQETIEREWNWYDDDNNERTTLITVDVWLIKGRYDGPYEDSYPDECGYDIIDEQGDKLTDEARTEFEAWCDEYIFEQL